MPGWLATTIFVLARVSALVLIVPGFSHAVVPWRVRILVIVLLVIPILCVVQPCDEGLVSVTTIPSLLAHELVVGVSLGLVPAAVVWGLQVAVQAMHGMTGLPGAAEAADHRGADAPLQSLLMMTVLTVFFVSSGHREVFQSVLNSFNWLPPGSFTPLQSVRGMIVDLLSASFALGVRAMSPIAASLAIGLMTLAAINRIIPQFGYFAVGMSVQTLVLLGSLVIFMGGVVLLLEHSFLGAPESVRLVWEELLPAIDTR
jgi:flagellar biosynthetic protein FliR